MNPKDRRQRSTNGDPDDEYDGIEEVQSPYQPGGGYQPPMPTARRSRTSGASGYPGQEPNRTPAPRPPTRPRPRSRANWHPVLYLGLGMLAFLILWQGGAWALANWVQPRLDDHDYGYPRTRQLDANLGHRAENGSAVSHLIVINLNGEVVLMEFPGGMAKGSTIWDLGRVYSDDRSVDITRVPIDLAIQDIGGPQNRPDGKQDVLIKPRGMAAIAMLNDGNKLLAPAGLGQPKSQIQRKRLTPVSLFELPLSGGRLREELPTVFYWSSRFRRDGRVQQC
jgi:hypothetical protein